jgi:hypothetical protein
MRHIENIPVIGYHPDMTMKERHIFFKFGLCIAVLAIMVIAAASVVIFPVKPPVYPEVIQAAAQRPAGLIAGFLKPSAKGVFASILLSAVYALTAIIFIYRFFEKTQSPEILFFGFFAVSFAFEACRVAVPFIRADELPGIYLAIAGRMLLFGRCLGVFSLFMASIHASGFNAQGQKYAVIILISVSIVFAAEAPIDGFSWNTALSMINGYQGLFKAVETSIAVITLIGFLISTLTRGSSAYFFICAGVLLVFIGRNFLLNADTWVASALGALFLGAGTWLICTKLHSVYLWL